MTHTFQNYRACLRQDLRCFHRRQASTISHLSDNVEQWPKDPFAIIGVERSEKRTDIRRAYSRLIRLFRPETHPVHFQKLHEAYEIALAIVDGAGANMLSPNSGPVFDFKDHADSVRSTAAVIDSEGQAQKTAENLWQQFVKQPDISGFSAAKKLAESDRSTADVFLMLYWMLRLNPHLAPGGDRISWLEHGLRRYPHEERFVDLIIAELRADSSPFTSEHCHSIAAQIASPDSLARFLSVRWDVLGRNNAWQELEQEINQVRTRFGLDQTETWVRLLITAYEILSFSTGESGQQLLGKVKQEIASFSDLELTLSEDLESLELWQLFRVQRGKEHRNQIVDFVTSQRFTDMAAVERATLEIIQRWIDRPRIGLSLLTSTAADYPEAFWQFVRYVAMIDSSEPEPTDSKLTTEIAEFFPETYDENYAGMRFRILEFCGGECIGPAKFFHGLVAVADRIGLGDELLSALQADLPLYVAIQCMHVFQKSASPEFNR